MESWRKVWREGVEPLLSTQELEALRQGLATDDVRLLQGATTNHPPSFIYDWPWAYRNWLVTAACAIGYCGWQGDGLKTVGEVEEFLSRKCYEIDERLGEPAGCWCFLNWWDETPREEVRQELLREVERAINERQRMQEKPA